MFPAISDIPYCSRMGAREEGHLGAESVLLALDRRLVLSPLDVSLQRKSLLRP